MNSSSSLNFSDFSSLHVKSDLGIFHPKAEENGIHKHQPVEEIEFLKRAIDETSKLMEERKKNSSLTENDLHARHPDVFPSKLEGELHIDDILMKPNIDEKANIVEQLMNHVNDNSLDVKKSFFGTTIVEPGNIQVLTHNGSIKIIGEGRWLNLNPRTEWGPVFPLDKNIIHKTLSVIRVPKGRYGLAVYGGKYLMLSEGVHVRNDKLFRYIEDRDVYQHHIQHGTIHIIRVPNAKYALVEENGVSKLLVPGTYAVDSSYFAYTGMVDIGSGYISHGNIHIIRVQKSKIGLVMINNRPELLYDGTYVFNSPLVRYNKEEKNVGDTIIHSTITQFQVKHGMVATVWYQNKPIFIDQPGTYTFNDALFKLEKFVAATEKAIVLGSKMRIIVYDGEVGLSYVKGKLSILEPDTYTFDGNDRIFKGFLSTKQQSIELIEDGQKDHFLRCDTKDFVEVGIKASVFFRISKPEVTLTTIGEEKAIFKIVKDTCIATLQGIMRCSALNQVAQSKLVHANDSKSNNEPIPIFFFDKIHDEFIAKLHDAFIEKYGIDISNIRIEDFKIMDEELANNISKQAIITAQTETQLANLTSQKEIATKQQERDAEVDRIKAKGDALKLSMETEAKNKALISNAETEAKSIETLAQAKANALIIQARAESETIRLKAVAEKKRAEDVSSTELGPKLAILEIQSQMVTNSLQGIQKIVYLPSDANMGMWPAQFFGMENNLNSLNVKK